MNTKPLDFIELSHATHTLIAGTTGSGKSTLIHSLISAILSQGADIGLIDPKRIELSPYEPIARFYACEVKEAEEWLNGVIKAMEDRYTYMKSHKTRICPYKHLFIIIDELADLMVQDKKGISAKIQRITQLGRGCNIHVIAATQAPDRTHTLPATMKLNFDSRIALRCAEPIESKQIIDRKGAEQLPKYGFCIWKNGADIDVYSVPYVSDSDIERTVKMYS